MVGPGKGFHTYQGERISGVNGTRATIKVPTHRATPPSPLRMSGLLKRAVKEPTLEGITPVRAALAEVIDILRTIFAYKALEERDA